MTSSAGQSVIDRGQEEVDSTAVNTASRSGHRTYPCDAPVAGRSSSPVMLYLFVGRCDLGGGAAGDISQI